MKLPAQQFLQQMYGCHGMLAHLYTSMDAQIAGQGCCVLHNRRQCRLPAEPHADLLCIGPPCQPWSAARQKNAGGPRTGCPEEHPGYKTTMEQVPALLWARMPKGALIEETPMILRPQKKGLPSACDLLVMELNEIFPGVEVAQLDLSSWANIARNRQGGHTHQAYYPSRRTLPLAPASGKYGDLVPRSRPRVIITFFPRVFIGCFSEELGGKAAAKEWADRIDKVLAARTSTSPLPFVGGVCSVDEISTAMRRWGPCLQVVEN